jgi:hypothetical protein
MKGFQTCEALWRELAALGELAFLLVLCLLDALGLA